MTRHTTCVFTLQDVCELLPALQFLSHHIKNQNPSEAMPIGEKLLFLPHKQTAPFKNFILKVDTAHACALDEDGEEINFNYQYHLTIQRCENAAPIALTVAWFTKPL